MKKIKYKSFILEWLPMIYRERLTGTGKVLFWILVLSSALGLYSFAIKIYFMFIVSFVLLFISVLYSDFFTRFFPPRFMVWHNPPARSTCGHSVSFKVHLRNLTKKWYFDLFLREGQLPSTIIEKSSRECYVANLEPHGEAEVECTLNFTKRGHYVLPGIVVQTSFPFGLWRGERFFVDEKSLLVYPHFHPLKSLDIPAGKRHQPGGISLTSYLGDSMEFIGNREFHQGDSPRNIHWRSWARLGKPVVKEFQEEYFCRIALLLDTYVPPGSKPPAYEAFESAISIAAAIADNLSRQEYIIDIFAAGPNIYYLQAGRALAYLDNILDILACLEHCTEPPFDRLEPVLLENLSQITTCIMVFLDWDETREQMVRTTYSLGTSVKAYIVRDGPPTVDPAPYEELVGRIARITPEMERRGVENL